MTRFFVACACGALLLAWTVPAAAQSAGPPQIATNIVVTATLAPADADALGRPVVVLLRRDLDALGVTTLVDALRLLPGLDVRARGPYGVQTDLAIRGATFGQSLVMIDGFRLNDSQSGHHNAELPVPVTGVERIEVVAGAGSAVHGADALGGVVNVITRTDPHVAMDAAFGQHGYAAGQVSLGGRWLPAGWTLSGWGARSGGFTFDRDFAQGGAALQMTLRPALVADVRHQRRAFGANGFYGASPSKEWTDQTLGTLRWRTTRSSWVVETRGLYRNHGDHFRWDIARPGFAENRHRTDAVEGRVIADRALGRHRVTLGGGAAGDWIDSSNLGMHHDARVYGFGEVQSTVGERLALQAAARVDRYDRFGSAMTPSVAGSLRVANGVRLRGAISRAFRVPTFTELYYRDPAHQAQSSLRPERSWSADLGVDWARGRWSGAISPFLRWDGDIIDWVRDTPAELWQTTNVRDVRTAGFETHVVVRLARGLVRGQYTALSVDAPRPLRLSKYLLEYARHAAGVSLAWPLTARVTVSSHLDHRRRVGSAPYTLVALRVTHRLRRAELFIDGSNLLDTQYVEIPGVAMPGRWITAGLAIR